MKTIKLPIIGKKSPPGRVMLVKTDSFQIVTEALHVEFDEITKTPTGLLYCVDLYGANVSFHKSKLQLSIAMCATYVKNKKDGKFVIHPPVYIKGQPELTKIVTSLTDPMGKCFIYENQFGA